MVSLFSLVQGVTPPPPPVEETLPEALPFPAPMYDYSVPGQEDGGFIVIGAEGGAGVSLVPPELRPKGTPTPTPFKPVTSVNGGMYSVPIATPSYSAPRSSTPGVPRFDYNHPETLFSQTYPGASAVKASPEGYKASGNSIFDMYVMAYMTDHPNANIEDAKLWAAGMAEIYANDQRTAGGSQSPDHFFEQLAEQQRQFDLQRQDQQRLSDIEAQQSKAKMLLDYQAAQEAARAQQRSNLTNAAAQAQNSFVSVLGELDPASGNLPYNPSAIYSQAEAGDVGAGFTIPSMPGYVYNAPKPGPYYGFDTPEQAAAWAGLTPEQQARARGMA